MKKKLMISVALILTLVLTALGIAYGVMASSNDGEVGVSLTIVEATSEQEPSFTVSPDFLSLGDVVQGETIVKTVTLTKTVEESIIVYLDIPTVPWGEISSSSTAFSLHTDTKTISIYFDVSDSATPGNYTTSILFHE